MLIDVDLPEIEDVVPEEELRVLKDGSLTEKKRKVADRNQLYAELVCGIAVAIAANAVCAAPTLRAATVAGRTQRAKRGSGLVEDSYVYEVKLPRALLASFDAVAGDPLEAFRCAGARMQVNANGSLRTIAPPQWAGRR